MNQARGETMSASESSQSPTPNVFESAWAARLVHARWLVRAPIGLYRARLGFLLGSRFLMLEHTGRKSGARRYVVLEVIDRPRPGTYMVPSAFGNRAQWIRNVRADPHVRVYTGRRRAVPAVARLLTAGEAAAVLAKYEHKHPRAYKSIGSVLEAAIGAPLNSLPVIALELADVPAGKAGPE